MVRLLRRRPLVSVITATYNWATVLPYAIASVQGQTMADWELLVVGDACTDESEAVVRAIPDRRVHWHNLASNTGSQVGPNTFGLGRARAELVAYLGHDDLWLPDHLERLSAACQGGAGFVHARQLRIDPGRAPFVAPAQEWVYRPGEWISPTSVMHRRDDGRAVGGWRLPTAGQLEDPEANLWGRLTERLGPPVLLGAVTSVKLPAGLRSQVYRERPCDEQDHWWRRIRDSADAATFVASALADENFRPPSRYDIAAITPEFLGTAPELATAAERHRLGRISKGLDG